jgi:hypothetical protein
MLKKIDTVSYNLHHVVIMHPIFVVGLSHFLPCIVSKMQSGDHIFYIITMLAKFMEGRIL